MFVKYYFEERGEWLKIVSNFLGGSNKKGDGKTVLQEREPRSHIERERPGQHVHVIESDNPIPDGMGFEVVNGDGSDDGTVIELKD